MIAGIGADIVEVARVARLLERYGERFAHRVLTSAEWSEFQRSGNRQTYLAGRFAAKEAFAKALGTGLRDPVLLSSISVTNDPLGKPCLLFGSELLRLLETRGICAHHVTVTHERSLACAVVVLETRAS
jgi:holo-[acyl-carrier protein] synthase